MKNYLAVLAALTVATPLNAQTSFGARAGMTLSTLAAPEEEEFSVNYKAGLHLGLTASLGSGGPGLLLSAAYSQRGAALSADIPGGLDSGDAIEVSLDLAYIDVGAFGRIPVGAGPYLLVGPTLGLRIACSLTSTAQGSSVTTDCGEEGEDDPYKSFDFGASGGAGMSFDLGGRSVVVEALYRFGILNIWDGDDSVKNRGFTIRAGVDFGG